MRWYISSYIPDETHPLIHGIIKLVRERGRGFEAFWGKRGKSNIINYRIAGNFRGSKLSRIRPKIIFTELIFANFIIQPFCTVLFIISRILFSRISKNREKSESYWPRKFPAIRYYFLQLIFCRFYQTMREKAVTELHHSTGRRPHYRYTIALHPHTQTHH